MILPLIAAALWAPAPRAPWAAGGRLGAGLVKLSPTEPARFPQTTWQGAPAVSATGRWAFHPVLGLRGGLGLALKGSGLGDDGSLNVWSLQGHAALAVNLAVARWPVRPWLAVGPYAARRVRTTAAQGGQAVAAPDAPFTPWDWGLQTTAGVDFDVAGQRFAVDLRLETGLADLAEPAYPPFAQGQTLRQQALSLGLGWRWAVR